MKSTVNELAKLKLEIRAEYAKIWDRHPNMIDFCTNKISRAVRLSNGLIFYIEKRTIKTHFCFDDSYDYDGALRMAGHARSSEEYFKSENLKEIDEILKILKGEDSSYREPYMHRNVYNSYGKTNFADFVWHRYYDDLTMSESDRENHIRLEGEDLAKVTALYEEERGAFEKRLNSYLKRYGMSKVESWTYWGEA